jgi:hypothetical protein
MLAAPKDATHATIEVLSWQKKPSLGRIATHKCLYIAKVALAALVELDQLELSSVQRQVPSTAASKATAVLRMSCQLCNADSSTGEELCASTTVVAESFCHVFAIAAEHVSAVLSFYNAAQQLPPTARYPGDTITPGDELFMSSGLTELESLAPEDVRGIQEVGQVFQMPAAASVGRAGYKASWHSA